MSKSCILSAPCDVSQNIIDVDVILRFRHEQNFHFPEDFLKEDWVCVIFFRLPFQKNFRELTWWSSQNLIFQKTFLGANVVVSEKFNFPEDFDCNSSDYLSRRIFGTSYYVVI